MRQRVGMREVEDRRAWLRSVGRRVRIARLKRELTQEQLGEAAGLSRSFVSLAEHGSDVSLLRLWRVATALGLPVVELLDPDGDSGSGNP